MRLYFPRILAVGLLFSCSPGAGEDIFVDPQSMRISTELSNQDVTAFEEDALGYMWIGTERGLNRYDSKTYHQYFHNPADSASIPADGIECLLRDSKDRLWVGTTAGVCRFTGQGDFKRVKTPGPVVVHQIFENREGRIFFNAIEQLWEWLPEADSARLVIHDFDPTRQYINDCFVAADGDIWSVTGSHARQFDGSTLELERDFPTGVRPHFSCLVKSGFLWIIGERTVGVDTNEKTLISLPDVLAREEAVLGSNGSLVYETGDRMFIYTERGFRLYEPGSGIMIREDEKGFPFNPPEGIVTDMFVDSCNNMWIALKNKGFAVRYNFTERFNSDVQLTARIRGKSITSMSVDSHGILWLMDIENHLFSYDATSGQVNEYRMPSVLKKPNKDQDPTSIFADRADRLWMINDGIVYQAKCSHGVCAVSASYGFPTGAHAITESADGAIWVGTASPYLYRLEKGSGKFTELKIPAPGMTMAGSLYAAPDGKIYAGMLLGGMVEVDARTAESRRIEDFGEKFWTCTFRDSSGNLWVGTATDGLLRRDVQTGKVETVADVSCPYICDVREDARGNIWISTQDGLDKYIVRDKRTVNYTAADGLGGNQFSKQASALLPVGELVFGGTHGVTIFNPSNYVPKRDVPLYFSDLLIGGRLVGAGNKVMGSSPEHFPQIVLRHNQNDFSLNLSALDYREHEKINFYYQLDGYEKQTHELGTSPAINLVNIPPGRYTLRAGIRNNDQSVTNVEQSLKIRVLPPWWQRWWAWTLYLLLASGILYSLVSARRRIILQRSEAERLEREKEQERRVNEMNMRFFGNISHEFRTPLTMISGPVAELEETEEGLSARGKKLLDVVQYNVSRMLRLVNQVLDFGKLDSDAIRLQVSRLDLSSLLSRLMSSYAVNAQQKGITLRESGLEMPLTGFFDADKMEKIVANLMSNAMKYTPKGGEISCSMDTADKSVTIRISDNGPSIPEDKLEKIFERYYQVDAHQGFGTGIGLYYARKLSGLHHGSLSAANLPEGGVVFTLTLPFRDVYSSEEHAPETEEVQTDLYPLAEKVSSSAEEGGHERTILVIDDDTSIVQYLTLLLSESYNVLSEFDAASGLATLKDRQPDLVLCDVAMPGEDGFSFCERAKNDLETSHVPVILVTAKSTVENQVQGLKKGADAYVTKPFDPDYLKALIESQLSNRERMRAQLGAATSTAAVDKDALSPQDESFMSELYALMEAELANPEVNVEKMAEMMKLSRSKFFYKIKGLTGEKPNVFFRRYKLNRAAELLLEGKLNVSEIAYATGFASLTVFSRNFKQQFGVTPREYRG